MFNLFLLAYTAIMIPPPVFAPPEKQMSAYDADLYETTEIQRFLIEENLPAGYTVGRESFVDKWAHIKPNPNRKTVPFNILEAGSKLSVTVATDGECSVMVHQLSKAEIKRVRLKSRNNRREYERHNEPVSYKGIQTKGPGTYSDPFYKDSAPAGVWHKTDSGTLTFTVDEAGVYKVFVKSDGPEFGFQAVVTPPEE